MNELAKPRIVKVVVSMGVKQAAQDRKKLDLALADLTKIAGQRPVVSRAKKSIAGFRLREGMEIGCFVTLRRKRMKHFLERLVRIVLPRVRDFRGLRNASFDGRGNYSFGLVEQGVFPEIQSDGGVIHGMNVTIVTTAGNDADAKSLLAAAGVPFAHKVER